MLIIKSAGCPYEMEEVFVEGGYKIRPYEGISSTPDARITFRTLFKNIEAKGNTMAVMNVPPMDSPNSILPGIRTAHSLNGIHTFSFWISV